MNPTFLPTKTHNPYKTFFWLMILVKAILAISFVVFYLAGAEPAFDKRSPDPSTPATIASTKEEEPQECPEGYFWRGGCVQVTGCPYGDSIPMDMCDKFAPESQEKPMSQNMVTGDNPVETVDKVKGK